MYKTIKGIYKKGQIVPMEKFIEELIEWQKSKKITRKNLPLLTRNLKHFEKIEEIRLCPVYKYESDR